MINQPKVQVIKTIHDLKKWRSNLLGTVGFIPTMGYLHPGHLSLVNLALTANDHVVISIFVNPKQFGPKEDLQKYPRDIERDLQLLQTLKKAVTVFLPDAQEMYPEGYQTYVDLQEISTKLEGKSRPGHFRGVATVVSKLFNLVQPTRAYFGQKDAQQVAVIKRMVINLNFPIEVVVGKIIREADGLAMSSRNVFLNEQERKQASVLYQSLCLANKLCEDGEKSSQKIKTEMTKLIETTVGKIDYISIADPVTLNEITLATGGALVSLAVRFGQTRLIDNVCLENAKMSST